MFRVWWTKQACLSLSLSLNFWLLSLPLHINLPEVLCYFRGHVILFPRRIWRQQGARGKGRLSSLLRPHTKLTNSNSNGDQFWPIARKLPWRWIATDPTNARARGGECSTHARAFSRKEGGDLRSSFCGREHRRVCAL